MQSKTKSEQTRHDSIRIDITIQDTTYSLSSTSKLMWSNQSSFRLKRTLLNSFDQEFVLGHFLFLKPCPQEHDKGQEDDALGDKAVFVYTRAYCAFHFALNAQHPFVMRNAVTKY